MRSLGVLEALAYQLKDDRKIRIGNQIKNPLFYVVTACGQHSYSDCLQTLTQIRLASQGNLPPGTWI